MENNDNIPERRVGFVSASTKVILPIINFFLLFCAIVTGTFAAATWKSEIDNAVVSLRQEVRNEIEFRIAEDEFIKEELKSNEILLVETKAELVENTKQLAAIRVDLKWIINSMSNMEE